MISAVMALDALREQCELVDGLEARLTRERAIRDDLIRAARTARIPYATLQRPTKLSRDRLVKIAHSAPSGVSLSEEPRYADD